jgi:hypothetical protein
LVVLLFKFCLFSSFQPSKKNAWTESGRSELIKLPPGVTAPEPAPVKAPAPEQTKPAVSAAASNANGASSNNKKNER